VACSVGVLKVKGIQSLVGKLEREEPLLNAGG
jgi:hypothetical protein